MILKIETVNSDRSVAKKTFSANQFVLYTLFGKTVSRWLIQIHAKRRIVAVGSISRVKMPTDRKS